MFSGGIKRSHWHEIGRSSQQRSSIKKVVLKIFAKFTRKYLCQILFFNKVEGLRAATLLKRDPGTGEFCEISKNTSRRLLLNGLMVKTELICG